MRSGHTLVELVVALAVLAMAGGTLIPAARRQADRMAVVGAREALAALIARTRSEAMARGGATLELGPAERVVLRAFSDAAPDSALVVRDLREEFGAALELGGRGAVAELRFDALGVGRAASRTLTLVRGSERAELVVAAYGRVVRR